PISESGGVMRLVVVDFETMKGRSFVADRGADVGSFRWLTNDIIQLRTTRRGARQFDRSWADFYPAYVSLSGSTALFLHHAARAERRVPGSDTLLIVDDRNEGLI